MHSRAGLYVVSFLLLAGCASDKPTPTPTPSSPDGGAVDECPEPTGTGMTHQGFIEEDETWTAKDSPHHVTFNVEVRGAKLTIEPCAKVVVDEGYYISVGQHSGDPASLVAKGEVSGEVERPITFTSAADDEWWSGLSALATGKLELANAIVSRAGHGNGNGVGHPSAIMAYGDDNRKKVIANVSLKQVVIADSANLALSAMASGGFTEDSSNVFVSGAGTQGTRSGNVLTTYPVYVEAPAIHTLPEGSYTYNAVPKILIMAPFILETDETIPERGVPYQMVGEFIMRPASATPTKLTIEPGVTLAFGGKDFTAATGMVLGDDDKPLQLIANGTAEKPITLTSGAESPAAGDWSGLWWDVAPSSGNVLRHVTFEYAGGESATKGFGCGPADNDALLFLGWAPSDAFIEDSTFRDSAAGGIVSGWGSGESGPDLHGSNTFDAIANGCFVSKPRDEDGACPGDGTSPACY